MKIEDLIVSPPKPPKHQFYTQKDLAEFLGTSQGRVGQWAFKGYIPLKWQKKIEEMTNGRFKASIDDLGDS